MKNMFLCILAACALTLTTAAAYLPNDVVTQNLDGRQLVIKTLPAPRQQA